MYYRVVITLRSSQVLRVDTIGQCVHRPGTLSCHRPLRVRTRHRNVSSIRPRDTRGGCPRSTSPSARTSNVDPPEPKTRGIIERSIFLTRLEKQRGLWAQRPDISPLRLSPSRGHNIVPSSSLCLIDLIVTMVDYQTIIK